MHGDTNSQITGQPQMYLVSFVLITGVCVCVCVCVCVLLSYNISLSLVSITYQYAHIFCAFVFS